MAKATILICDRCKTQEPAADTLTLKRGRGTSVELDLCRRHIKEVVAFFSVQAPKPKREGRADYEIVCTKVLELAEARPMFTGSDVCKVANVRPSVANNAVKRLIAAGKIVATGNSAGRKLSKAS